MKASTPKDEGGLVIFVSFGFSVKRAEKKIGIREGVNAGCGSLPLLEAKGIPLGLLLKWRHGEYLV